MKKMKNNKKVLIKKVKIVIKKMVKIVLKMKMKMNKEMFLQKMMKIKQIYKKN